jgi:hypothetical protein
MMAAPNPLEWVLLVLLGGGLGLPPGMPPAEEAPLAAKVAPAECLFYASWAATGAPQATSSNQTEQLLAEREVQDFLSTGRQRVFDLVRQAGPAVRQPDGEQITADVTKLLELMRGKPGALYLAELSFKTNGPPRVKAAGLIQLDDKTAEAKKLIETMQGRLLGGKAPVVKIGDRQFYRIQVDPQTPSITWGVFDKYLVVGLGDRALEELIDRAGGEAPGWLKDIRAKLSVPRVSSVSYVNVGRLVKIVMEGAPSPDAARDAARVISVLGLDKVSRFAAVSGLDEKGCVSRALLSVEGKGAGALSWLELKPLSADDLRPVGSDALAAVALKLDATDVFDLWLKTLEEADPREAEQIRRGMDEVAGHLGFSVRDDLLKSLGDTWRVFIQPVGPGALIHGWTLAVPIRNRQNLVRVQDILVTTMKNDLERGGDGVPTLTSKKVGDVEVHTLDFAPVGAPFAPSWCLTKDEFFLAATPQALQSLLSPARSPSLAQQPDVARLVAKDAKTLSLGYVDTRKIVETVLPKLPELLRGLGHGMPPLDTSQLPSSQVFLRHLQPGVFSVSRTADGVELVCRHTLPGANVATVAPAAVAVMLPAVQVSRQSAQRAQAANQLKQIVLGLHNFASANRNFPAGYSADAKGKPLLSWRVHILPYIEENDLYQQFHLDEPWDSPHNKTLIAQMPRVYRAPKSKGKPGMTNYLGVSGADGIFIRPAAGSNLGTSFAQIRDGTSNTIMTVEVPDESAVIWTKPGDFAPNKEKPLKGLVGLIPGGFQAGFADGSVRFISEKIAPATLRALFTKSGGEPINANSF